MITAAPAPLQPSSVRSAAARWQQAWREAVRDPRELLSLLGLDAEAASLSEQAAAQFALRVPRGFVARMRRGDL
ncbi:MAG TPA: EF-P beta-lysylation protein EpmB, partial [Xanthomonadaceae bacterium]|nr:EF-P beta-lysylation protein EpmB [Xanthomonadaceae bacterium]